MQPPWNDLLAEPLPRDHVVQLYRDDRILVEAVALFAGAGIGKSEAVLLVAAADHIDAVERHLAAKGYDVQDLKAWGQLRTIDAASLLAQFMVDDLPDPTLFRAVLGERIDDVRAAGYRKVRVYGEMVNLLWRLDPMAAGRLEELWNELIQARSISLFCAYELGPDAPALPRHLRAAHSHVIPLDASVE
jgi:hypothetical protein